MRREPLERKGLTGHDKPVLPTCNRTQNRCRGFLHLRRKNQSPQRFRCGLLLTSLLSLRTPLRAVQAFAVDHRVAVNQDVPFAITIGG